MNYHAYPPYLAALRGFVCIVPGACCADTHRNPYTNANSIADYHTNGNGYGIANPGSAHCHVNRHPNGDPDPFSYANTNNCTYCDDYTGTSSRLRVR
jgi:hypothetical protein